MEKSKRKLGMRKAVTTMPDKKLTDNEIKKALKEILEIMLTMGDLQKAATISKSIDLINRKDEELNRLQEEISVKNKLLDIAEEKFEKIKAEAYKEFADRLKAKLFNTEYHIDRYYRRYIDNLLKEMGANND